MSQIYETKGHIFKRKREKIFSEIVTLQMCEEKSHKSMRKNSDIL